MTFASLLTDVEGWATDAESLATSAIPVLGAVDDSLKALSAITNLLNGYQTKMNTPAMVNASAAQKLQAFHDHVNEYSQQGNEGALESLMSSSGQ